MRSNIPTFTRKLTNDEFLQLIPDAFQSVIFGTVDADGNPRTNVADIELKDGDWLIFATTYQKPFYQRLKNHPQISITALKGDETLNSVGFDLVGIATEVDRQYINQIFKQHPEMTQISSNHSERRSLLRPFAIQAIWGSIYDLRQNPIFQQHITFQSSKRSERK